MSAQTLIFSIFLVLFSFLGLAQKSVPRALEIQGDWTEYIRFISNIGSGKEVFEDVLFREILNLEGIENLPGFESPERTRIVLSTYELAHRRIVDFVKYATEKGFRFKIVLDGNLLHQFKPLSLKKLEKLTPSQREYYFRTYDMNQDGQVTQSDADLFNKKHAITRWCWRELQKLPKSLVKLISSPHEVIPHPNLNYPRIHHLKEYGIQFRQDGQWVDQKSWIPSSNLTDTGQRGRISNSYANYLRYIRASESVWRKALKKKKITQKSFDDFINAQTENERYQIRYAKTNHNPQTNQPLRSGHIQVGMLFQNPLIIKTFKSDLLERWSRGYEKGLFFDELPPRSRYFPQVILREHNGHISRLNLYSSEGLQLEGAETDFVFRAYQQILGDPGNIIKVFKTSQFVMTHPKILAKIKKAIAGPEFERAFMIVDGNFSTETYSAFPYLSIPRVNDRPYTAWTKALEHQEISQETQRKILESMFSFDGHMGIYGASDGVKLHAKFSYLEYIDSRGTRHHVVIQGSGNLSMNAGKGNADALIVFDTTDPRLKNQVSPYFEALEKNPRTRPLLETYLQKRLAHVIRYNQEALAEIKKNQFEYSKKAKFMEENHHLLNMKDGLLTVSFAQLLKGELSLLEEKNFLQRFLNILRDPKTGNGSAFNKNLTKILQFYTNLSNTPLRFQDFDQMLYMSNPQTHPYQGLQRRLIFDWLKRESPGKQEELETKLQRLFTNLTRFDKSHRDILLDPFARKILADCNAHFKRLGLEENHLSINVKEVP